MVDRYNPLRSLAIRNSLRIGALGLVLLSLTGCVSGNESNTKYISNATTVKSPEFLMKDLLTSTGDVARIIQLTPTLIGVAPKGTLNYSAQAAEEAVGVIEHACGKGKITPFVSPAPGKGTWDSGIFVEVDDSNCINNIQ